MRDWEWWKVETIHESTRATATRKKPANTKKWRWNRALKYQMKLKKESEDDNGQWKGKNETPTDNWAQKWKRKWNTKRKRNVIYFTICSIWKMNKTFIHFFSMHLAYCVLSSASLFRFENFISFLFFIFLAAFRFVSILFACNVYTESFFPLFIWPTKYVCCCMFDIIIQA